MILDLIKKNVRAFLEKNNIDLKIIDAFVGYFYTVVVTEDSAGEKYIGLNLTPSFEFSDTTEVYNNPAFFDSIIDEVELLTSESWIERSLALATVNSLSQKLMLSQKPIGYDEVKDTSGWIINKLREVGANKVALIGNMPPVVDSLSKYFDVVVFDKRRCGRVLSESLEKRILPNVDAVVTTGAVIVNETIDEILDYAKKSKINIVIGPSAQIHPEFIKGIKIDYLGSTAIIRNKEEAIRLLKLGYVRGVFYNPKFSVQYFIPSFSIKNK